MRTDFEKWTTKGKVSIRQAMKMIDSAALGIVLVVDDQRRLLGTITDGDIRRAILKGISLETDCDAIMNESPICTQFGQVEVAAKQLMRSHRIRHLPVLTDQVLVGLWCLSEATDPLPAVLMAGGLGSRLGELTKDTPKPLLEVGGRPILEHIIDHLRNAGVEDVYITTRYLAEKIESHFGEGKDWGVSINYIREQERLGTAGALKLLEGRIHKPFLVMNGDLITDFRVSDMFDFHNEHNAKMTVAVRHYAIKVPFGVVTAEGVDIIGISEKPTFDFFVNAGIYIVEPEILYLIESGRMFDIPELIEKSVEAGHRVVSFPMFEDWFDVGRPEDFLAAQSRV